MLKKLLILFTNYLLKSVRLDKQIRRENDIRIVHYHGIGENVSACMKYLNDEIPRDVFKAHIDYLQDKYALFTLKDAIAFVQDGELPKGKLVCAISFDDGLNSVYTNAFPLLKERGIPFDVFLNTSSIGNNDLLWLHALNYLSTTYGPDKVAEAINGLIDADIPQAPLDARGIERWCRGNFEYFYESNLISKLFENYGLSIEEIAAEQDLYLSWDQIEEMSAYGVGFYSHTHRHFPLNAFSKEDPIKTEIETAFDIMEAHHKNNDFISFPFGMEIDYGKKAIKYALSAGHKFVVEVGNGLNSQDRIIKNKIISRVGLGNTGSDIASLYAAIEIKPVIKMRLKSIIKRVS